MELSTKNLTMKIAKTEHHDKILDITKEELLYNGMDYLSIALRPWLEESDGKYSNRLNVIFTLEDRVVGFRSVYFLNDKKVAIRFAFRISKDIRGKGFGRQATKFLDNHLRYNYPNLTSTLSSIHDLVDSDDDVRSSKHGTLLASKSCPTYNMPCDELKGLSITNTTKDLSLMSKEKFRTLLKNKDFEQLLPNNLLHVNWIPIILETEDDIEFLVRKKQIVMAKNHSWDHKKSFSILTLPYHVQNGNLMVSIDIFTEYGEFVTAHLEQQLLRLKEEVNKQNSAKEFIISIVVNQDLTKVVFDCMAKLGLQKYYFVSGSQKREVNNMYIYQKPFQ